MPRALIVGVGPGAPDLLTERARAAVAAADAILAWELNLTPLAGSYGAKRLFVQHPGDYEAVAREAIQWARVTNATLAVVRIGDALVSSGLTSLLALLEGFEAEIVPGISAVQLAAARARINLDEAVVSSFHEERDLERERAFVHVAFRRGRHLIVLTGPHQPPEATARYLIERAISPKTATLVAENLSLPNERIVRGSLADIARGSYHWLSILVVLHPRGIDPSWTPRARAAASRR
jgi:cobalt-precorrin-7 (C5)-methyltransferase